MKKNILLLYIGFALFLFGSCYKDLGSYDYQAINELSIDGLGEDLSVIYKKDTIRIVPELKFTHDSVNADRYEYEWKVIPKLTTSKENYIIGRTRNLEYFTELLPGTYTLYLKVKDKETDLVWKNSTSLAVRTQVARGFLLLGEKEDGYVGLDMISFASDTIILKDLLKNNGLPPLRDPVRVMYTGSSSAAMDPYVRLWIMTKDGSYYVNTTDFTGTVENNLKNMIYTSFELPEVLNPVHMIAKSSSGSMSKYRIMVCEDGNAFYIISLGSGEYYPNPVNRSIQTPETLYKAFPYIFTSPANIFGFLLYDTDQDRFLQISVSEFDPLMSLNLNDKSGDVFPWNQGNNGRELVYGENTMNTDGGSKYGNSFALMKDGEGNFFIYKFYVRLSVSKRGAFAVKSSMAPALNEADLFAFSSKRTLFLYAVGKTLYAYDYNDGHEKIYTKEFEDEITMIKFDIESNTAYNQLWVATYNAEKKGILQKYILQPDQNTFELIPDKECYWDGLVKIKSMDWRNSAK